MQRLQDQHNSPILISAYSQHSVGLHIFSKHEGAGVRDERCSRLVSSRSRLSVYDLPQSVTDSLVQVHLASLTAFACRTAKAMAVGKDKALSGERLDCQLP